jgi:hypothetical protein
MSWESAILNRIYRTNEFKINTYHINNLQCKKLYIKKIEDLLMKFNLNKKSIFISKETGALFNLQENKKPFYFSYNTNLIFYLYSSFFSFEEKYINYKKLIFRNNEGVFYTSCEDNNINNEVEEIQKGKNYANLVKDFLFNFLFSLEFLSDNKFEFSPITIDEFFNKYNNHFKFNSYLIGDDFSLYDIILLSILINFKEKICSYIDLDISIEEFKEKAKYNMNLNMKVNNDSLNINKSKTDNDNDNHTNIKTNTDNNKIPNFNENKNSNEFKFIYLQRWVIFIKEKCDLE